MNIFKNIQGESADKIWNIFGSFGKLRAPITASENTFTVFDKQCKVESSYTKDKNGTYFYTGDIENISENDITLNGISSKFIFDGGEYDVYTQSNSWQNESMGSWQPLNSSVGVSTSSIRTSYGCAPMLAFWNNQTNRGYVFHLFAAYAWKMTASIIPSGGEPCNLLIEIGINNENFAYKLAPSEKLNTPQILFYEFKNKTDLDCFKLHSFLNENFKDKKLAVIYNTWLCRFHDMTFENVASQIEPAAKIGAEYFVIDSGWYGEDGDKEFWAMRGDWVENKNKGLSGKLSEISELVQKNGMSLGIWFEIESAGEHSKMMQKYPELYLKTPTGNFIDFANPNARDMLYGLVSDVISKYNIGFIKFDFNQDMDYDKDHCAYIKYLAGFKEFVLKIKENHPGIYIESCASGGLRMDIGSYSYMDGFWLSDNQSPYESMRIFKETILRLSPKVIEKWAVIQSLENFDPVYPYYETEKILSTHDAVCDTIVGMHDSFLKGFLSGGPIGLSCDLTHFSDALFESVRTRIAEFKKNREFLQKAAVRILSDTKSVLALEYSDDFFAKVKIAVFSFKLRQNNICVYPVLDENSMYKYGESILSAKEITENGIDVSMNQGNFRTYFVELERIK